MIRKARIVRLLYWRTSNSTYSLAPSRQADKPVAMCLVRQQGTCEQVSMGQAGRQATSKRDTVRGFPVRGVESLQSLPAGA